MKAILNSKLKLIILFVFSLPILMHVFNPSMQLGALGMILGLVGMTISPLILFGVFIYLIINAKN